MGAVRLRIAYAWSALTSTSVVLLQKMHSGVVIVAMTGLHSLRDCSPTPCAGLPNYRLSLGYAMSHPGLNRISSRLSVLPVLTEDGHMGDAGASVTAVDQVVAERSALQLQLLSGGLYRRVRCDTHQMPDLVL